MSSLWTDEELGRARLASIRQHLRDGWKFVDGWLEKGHVTKRPSTKGPAPQPWEPEYNPLKHSVAVRMGGEFVSAGVYRLAHNGLYVDENGAVMDDSACFGCGTRRGPDGRVVGPDYRWSVRTTSANPFAPPWVKAWTYCRRCVTPEELQSQRAFQERERLKREAEQSRQHSRSR